MSVAHGVTEQLERASWIRRMFEEGARLKAELGAENVCDFTLGNPDLEPPAAVLEILRRVAGESRPHSHAYMPNAGYPQVREKVAAYLGARTGLDYTAEDILMTVGSAGACNAYLRSILDPGDEVIVLMPCFSEYPFYIQNHAGRMVPVESAADFLPDVDRIASAITPRTKAIILNSPNNPTGRVYPEAVLRGLNDLLESLGHAVTVISDEPYTPIVFDGLKHPEVASIIRRTVVANSWSKTFSIPGERIGYLAISPRLEERAALQAACTFSNRVLGFVNAPAIWQWVIGEALDVPIDVREYQTRRDRMCDTLARMGYEVSRPEGTFYIFPKTPIPDDIAFVRLLAQEGVLGVPGAGFGRSGYFRLSLTVPMDTIERSVAGFERAMARARQ